MSNDPFPPHSSREQSGADGQSVLKSMSPQRAKNLVICSKRWRVVFSPSLMLCDLLG
jgi:hypothetical protein